MTSLSPRIRVAAIIAEGDTVLLVRHLKEGRSYWLLPGGGVEFGEALGDALVREVYEEVRLRIAPRELMFASDAITPDGSRHTVHLGFAADRVAGEVDVGEDPRVVEAAYVPVDRLTELTLFPDMAPALQEAIRSGFEHAGRYLGTLWKP